MEQNKEEKKLTLTLPFLEFKDASVSINLKDSYKKNGLYFVQNASREYFIVSVVKEEDNIWSWPLPLGAQNYFAKQHMEQEQNDKFKHLEQLLMDIHNNISTRLDEQHDQECNYIKDVYNIANRIEDNVGILANIEEHLSSNNQNSNQPNGGYVDQDVLLQIIKEVKS